MINTIDINNLKDSINNEILATEGGDVFNYIKRRTLQSKAQRIEQIEELLNIEKYKIVFIGTVGAGKTTAISHLFNLIDKVSDEKTLRSGRKKKFKKTEPLFSTGSGKTTISEVEITADKETTIQIEPYSRKSVEKLIESFIDNLYSEDKEGGKLSTELERAVRNITQLKNKTVTNTDPKSPKKSDVIDIAFEKSKELSKNELLQLAFKNADLDNRSFEKETSILKFEKGVENEWLKKKFAAINRADVPQFSIPSKIYVTVSEKLLSGSQLSKFESVVDTKGIDENPNRRDLKDYIEAKNTIILFASSYNDAPETDIRDLSKYYLSQKSKKYEQKFSILVMPHKGEPEKENDGDGEWETGVDLKRRIITQVYESLNLKIISQNIIFYDALRCYDKDGKLDTEEYEEEDVQFFKNKTIVEIDKVVERRKAFLVKELSEIKEEFEQIQMGYSISKEVGDLINYTIEELMVLKNLDKKIPSFIFEEFIEEYGEYYGTNYPAWNTKDAIQRRYGIFDERNFDSYLDAQIVAEGLDDNSMLRKFTKDVKTEIHILLKSLGESHPYLKSITDQIKRDFEKYYDGFISETGEDVYNYLKKNNENRDFWKDLIERRGKGAGYNNDVILLLKENLKNMNGKYSNANNLLEEMAKTNWELMMNNLLEYFGR